MKPTETARADRVDSKIEVASIDALMTASHYDQAKSLLWSKLVEDERQYGAAHAVLFPTLDQLLLIAEREADQGSTASLLLRKLQISEQINGSAGEPTLSVLEKLAAAEAARGDAATAAFWLQRLVDAREAGGGVKLAAALELLGAAQVQQGRLDLAEASYQRALTLREQTGDAPVVALGGLSTLYRQLGRVKEADAMQSKLDALRPRRG
ncbi:tetratricopeptide repeat protein [Chitinibacteraceae bacterium HSL-7]